MVGTALKGVSSSHRAAIQRQVRNHKLQEVEHQNEARTRERIRQGTWHDGRLDCVAGNGVMSELGIGDELMGDDDAEEVVTSNTSDKAEHVEETDRKRKITEDLEAVGSLPIVMIRNYAAKVGSSREELLEVLAQWAAMLAENQVRRLSDDVPYRSIYPHLFQIAHVIVISDNRENSKLLAKGIFQPD